jgi:predicted  nucleic acid-binding Zn-ribbon protein
MAASQIIKVIFEGVDQTSKAVKNVKKGLGDTEKAIGNLQRSLGGMTGALAAAAGAAGFGLMAKNALATADALGKTSLKLGVTANELFKFQTQAELAGISTDTANMALQRFVRRTAEAAQGTGEAKNALIELGISAEDIQKLPLSERMKVLADAFAGVKSPADRLRLAFKLFDSEGAAMVNMLEGGSESLEETERRMKELGLEIDDTAIPAMEEFNDSLELMKRQVQVAMIQGLGEATPVLQDLSDKLAPVIVQITEGLLTGLQWMLDNLGTIVTALKAFAGVWATIKFASVISSLYSLGAALAALALSATPAALPILAIGAAIAAVTVGVAAFTGDLERIAEKFGLLEKSTQSAEGQTDEFAGAVEDLQEIVVTAEKKDLPAFAKEVDNIADEEIGATLRTNEFRVALEQLREKALKPKKDLEDYTAQMAILKNQFETGKLRIEEYKAMVKVLGSDLTGVESEVENIRQQINNLNVVLADSKEIFGENSDQVRALEMELESLGGELVEAIQATSTMTENQRELLEEATAVERKIAELNQDLADYDALLASGAISADQHARAVKGVREEITELNDSTLTDFERMIKDSFDATPVGEFLAEIEAITAGSGALGGLIDQLLGTGGVKPAIDNCFGTGPVTAFGDAVKDLFSGSGSALGGFGAALGNLTNALGGFFSGALSSFSSFKDAIIRTLEQIAAAAIASVGLNFLKNLIPGLRDGGMVEGFATGGRVSGPGGPTADRVPAMLSDGEYVIRASSVSRFGSAFFDALNSGRMPGFRLGGLFGGSYGSIDNFDWFDLFNQYFGIGSFAGGEGLAAGIMNTVTTILTTMEKFQEAIVQGVIDAVNAVTEQIFNGNATFETGYVTDIIDKILEGVFGDLIDVAQSGELGTDGNIFDRIREAIFKGGTFPNISDEFSEPFSQSMIDELIRMITNLQNMILDFSFDDHVKTLFNKADAVAGGSLYVQGRQFGGPLERGQASIVGEDGPELFIPGRGGTVSPINDRGGKDLIKAVNEVRDEIVDLRRQFTRIESGRALAGGRQ